jgi:hypothetical protein
MLPFPLLIGPFPKKFSRKILHTTGGQKVVHGRSLVSIKIYLSPQQINNSSFDSIFGGVNLHLRRSPLPVEFNLIKIPKSSDRWTFRILQHSETNVTHILINLLRIKGLYMFRTLLAHLQEALHKRNLVYYVRVISVGCYQGWRGNPLDGVTLQLW